MTYFPDIHTRAAQLVRESRGRLNLREAYAELSRRSHLARLVRKTQAMPKPTVHAWQDRADLS